MMYVTGAVCVAIGGWFAYGGWQARQSAKAQLAAAEKGEGTAPGEDLHLSLALLRDVIPPFIIFGLFVLGLSVLALFVSTQGAGLFAWADLVGFLLLLAGYGYWLLGKSAANRPPDPD